ncbi:MAG: response regulator [Myxococcota bacterium]
MAYTILVVEDEDTVRAALRRSLQPDGYDIVEASSGEDAVRVLGHKPVDLILSDYRMPGMNGLDFLKQARVLQPRALRVMLTAVADPAVIVSAINEGAVYRYLLKPWDVFDLRVMVRLALRHLEAIRATERDAESHRVHRVTSPMAS